MNKCVHNQRCRYTHGFHCEDCDTFFSIDSPTYRSDELIDSISMVIHNIGVDLSRANKESDPEIDAMEARIGIGKTHKDYESIIADAESLMAKYEKNSTSASVTLK